MSSDRVLEIQERLAKATPGPWFAGFYDVRCPLHDPGKHQHTSACVAIIVGKHGGTDIYRDTLAVGDKYDHAVIAQSMVAGQWDYDNGGIVKQEDADLIANAPADLQFLLSLVDELRKDEARLTAFEKYAMQNHGSGKFSTDVAEVEGVSDQWDEDEAQENPIEWSVAGPRIQQGMFAIGRGPTLRDAIDDAMREELANANATPAEAQLENSAVSTPQSPMNRSNE